MYPLSPTKLQSISQLYSKNSEQMCASGNIFPLHLKVKY